MRQPSDFLALKNVYITYHSKISLFKKAGRDCISWFVNEKANVDAAYHVGLFFPNLLRTCFQANSSFSKNSAGAYGTHRAGMASRCTEFIKRDLMATKFAGRKPYIDYCVWPRCWTYHKLHPKPKSVTELKEALQVIWDSLSPRN